LPRLARQVEVVAAAANRELDEVWELDDPVDVTEALLDLLPGVIETYGLAAATLAADYYDDSRARRNIRGRFTAIIPDMGDMGAEELARWGVGPLFQANPDWATAQTLIDGGLQRRVANYSRDTITESAVEDPQARGWQRVTSGGSCDFCTMLAGRGAIYTESSSDFESHDHCNCSAEPAWVGHELPVHPSIPTERIDLSNA
jgi:hypothetical protein